jgi:hypothetical protein
MSNDTLTTAPYIHTFGKVARIDLRDGINREPVPVLRDGDTITGLRTGTCTVSVHTRSRNEQAKPSLIPNASVIQAAHYGDLGKPEEVTELSMGDYVVVEGHGVYRVVRGTMKNGGNEDWPKLVPVDGRRYYIDYDGGPGYQSWTLRDATKDGEPMDHDAKKAACERVLGKVRIDSLIEAEAVCAMLNLEAVAA